MHKVLYVYKWATMGGVERVLLNRALAFKASNFDVAQDVFFLHDSGGKKLLNRYIEEKSLGRYLKIVEDFIPEKYDTIHPIDTPEIFKMVKNYEKILFECHTAYAENRQYLAELPMNIKGLIVPSKKFKSDILQELPLRLREKIFVFRNFIPESMFEVDEINSEKLNKIPITYIGRIDKLKNVEESVEIFNLLQKKLGDKFLLIVAGPLTSEVDLFKLVEKKGILNRFIYLPPIAFDKIPKLLKQVKENNGVVISSSKGESFGLSVAEAIVYGIPVIASHIHSHLVNDNRMFLYQLNDIEEAVNKIEYILNNRYNCMQELTTLKKDLTDNAFLQDWSELY
ncbi:glycosyltransferase family 4 protein [Lysinibacillus sp. fls2-241-R2A-57]|uniref:glycosyltransferase family 4 protein n=1 Tax=Lysinibacillus sp. fls2-241-R2A-57 TaxID=3040292 RepID=UPI0025550856|nr:glycosyltransferase family 4 protein [Lysinibacillus sp. fls2-241-R2A-57]